jgi:hypothetical protein
VPVGPLTLLALAFWAYYYVVQRLPLTADELYHSHIFWMVRNGLRPYVDFRSYHLPAYYWVPLPGQGLDFVWWLRGSCLAAVAIYAAMLRRELWPLMLVFAVFGRMTEIRPDTVGLLLFNAAWLALMGGRKNVLAAAALGCAALLFSARAALMLPSLAFLCAYFANKRSLRLLIAMGALFLAFLCLIDILEPAWTWLVIRSVFIDTLGIAPPVPMATRFFEPERLVLMLLIIAALGASVSALWRDRCDDRALVILVACASQLMLIIIDPAPFGYVYGWAMIPAVVGISLIGPFAAPLLGIGLAAMLFASSLTYPLRKGRAPERTSYARLTFEPRMAQAEIDRASTPRLVAMMVQPGDLWNQLSIRSEVCRRTKGTVAAWFWYHPICLRDADYDWSGLNSSPVQLRQIVEKHPPALIIWGAKPPWPPQLLTGYTVYPGFAVRPSTASPLVLASP